MSHTKGNWKVDDSIEYEVSVVSPWTDEVRPVDTRTFGDYRGAIICTMHYNSGVPTKETALANAKLIAAAPEMIQALIEISEGKGRYDLDLKQHLINCIEDMIQFAKDAIKKATDE